jgi:hypothetical protein
MNRDHAAMFVFGVALCALGMFILSSGDLSARMCGGGKGCRSSLAIGLSALSLGLLFILAPFFRLVSKWYSDLESVKAKRDAAEAAEQAEKDASVLKAWEERATQMKIIRPGAQPKGHRKRSKART